MELNDFQRRAIENEISFLEDNLARYKMQRAAIGNDDLTAREITDHERRLAKLKEGL